MEVNLIVGKIQDVFAVPLSKFSFPAIALILKHLSEYGSSFNIFIGPVGS
jgi:hypothetical protein